VLSLSPSLSFLSENSEAVENLDALVDALATRWAAGGLGCLCFHLTGPTSSCHILSRHDAALESITTNVIAPLFKNLWFPTFSVFHNIFRFFKTFSDCPNVFIFSNISIRLAKAG
jgi:hypothetical protein